jgi:hypothetical protein
MFALEGERLTIYLRFWSGQAPTGAHERWMVCGQEKKVLIFLSHCYPHLVSYILTIQMHLPIYKSPSAIPSYLQSFHSFCPGESQGNTESARLDCCTSFPNFPFLYSWRKTRENRISHTLLLHVHVLLEKDKGTGLLHSKWLFCGKIFMFSKQTFEKYPMLKTVF